jgi:hypothetical protein
MMITGRAKNPREIMNEEWKNEVAFRSFTKSPT